MSVTGHVTQKSHKSLERDKPKHSRHHLGQVGIQPRKHGNTVLGSPITSEDGGDGADDPSDPNYDDPNDEVATQNSAAAGDAADKPAAVAVEVPDTSAAAK
jgi:hypothetical protein